MNNRGFHDQRADVGNEVENKCQARPMATGSGRPATHAANAATDIPTAILINGHHAQIAGQIVL